ncbi:MAG: hypothetical protein KDD92_04350 [Caldilineaceae bacterium]|nr:hypothetical protein [Caldilineaceae bacterium]
MTHTHDVSLPAWPDDLEAPAPEFVAGQLAAFWTTLARLPDLLDRDERLLAADLLHDLRAVVIDLMLALNGIRRPPETVNLNRYLSANQRAALERTLTAPSPAGESWIGQAVALTVIYRWYAPQLVAHFDLGYPQAQEDAAWARLRAGIFEWPAAITSDDTPRS